MDTLQEHCKRIASIGGRVKSPAKAKASRQNAKRPRPNARIANELKRTKSKTKMADIAKILVPLPTMICSLTEAACCVVLVRDLNGEYHIVAEGTGWKAMVVAAAGRVLETAQTVQATGGDTK